MNLDQAEQLALSLMREHGLLPRWSFAFDRAERRFGSCNERKRRITLSAAIVRLNSESEVRDTILHEIAHALVGVRWTRPTCSGRTASLIGCNARLLWRRSLPATDEVCWPLPDLRL